MKASTAPQGEYPLAPTKSSRPPRKPMATPSREEKSESTPRQLQMAKLRPERTVRPVKARPVTVPTAPENTRPKTAKDPTPKNRR